MATEHYAGSMSDLEIFQDHSDFYLAATEKADLEDEIEDLGALSAENSQHWAVLVDKGYQGVQEFLRGIHPIRKSPNKLLYI